MGRGRSSSGGSSRGSSFGGGSRGRSRSSVSFSRGSRWGHSHHHTTVIVGGGHHHGHYHGEASLGTFIFMAVIFILFGLGALGFGISLFVEAGKYSSVQATCLDNERVNGWYYTTYEYSVKGTEYVNRSNEGWEFAEDEGAVVTIYYLKSDSNEITEERPGSIAGGIGLTVFALIFIGVGGLLIHQGVKSKKKVAQTQPDGAIEEKVETHNKCPYCGSKYNKSSDSCPKCGASKLD